MFGSSMRKILSKKTEAPKSPEPKNKPLFTQNRLNACVEEWERSGDKDSIPVDLICPLSLELMVDPVIVVDSGQTYERAYIEKWFETGNKRCPRSNAELSSTELVPNDVARRVISEWAARNQYEVPSKASVREKLAREKSLDKPGTSKGASGSISGSGSVPMGIGMRRQQFRGQRLQTFRDQMARTTPPNSGTLQQIVSSQETPTKVESNVMPSRSESEPVHKTVQNSSLTNISFRRRSFTHSETRIPAPSDDSILEAVEAAVNGDQASLTSCAESLRSFSRISKETRIRMARLGSIPVLIRLMKLSEEDNADIVENAATTILNLALERELKIPMAVAGALEPLVSLAVSAGRTTTRDNAIGAISNLSVAEENRDLIRDIGGIPLLISVLKTTQNGRARKDAAIGLFNLSLRDEVRAELIELGVVEQVVRMLEKGDHEAEEELTLVLYSATKSPLGCEKLLEVEGVGAVAYVLDGSSPRTQGHAVGTLLQIAQNSEEGLEEIRKEIVFATLVSVSENGLQRTKDKATALVKLLRGS